MSSPIGSPNPVNSFNAIITCPPTEENKTVSASQVQKEKESGEASLAIRTHALRPSSSSNPLPSTSTAITSHPPTQESPTVSAPCSRKRKERDEASLAIRTHALRPSSSSNPLPSTSTAITSHPPTQESSTVSAPCSRKRKERDEASLAIRTNALRPSSSSNPLPSTSTAITSHPPTQESLTVSAPCSRKRKERDEASLAISTNALSSSSSFSNPLPPPTLSHGSSTFATTPQLNAEANLNLRPELNPSNVPPMLASYAPVVSQPFLQAIYGVPLPGGILVAGSPEPLTFVPTLLNPWFSVGVPITVFPQLIVLAHPVFSFPPGMISATSGIYAAPGFQGQAAQPIVTPTNSANPALSVSARQVSDSPFVPSVRDASTTSGMNEPPNFQQYSPLVTIPTNSQISAAPRAERQIAQSVPISTNSKKAKQLPKRASRVTIPTNSEISEAPRVERQIAQPLPISTNSKKAKQLPKRASRVTIPTNSEISATPRVERQIAQPVPISANAEKSEQLPKHASRVAIPTNSEISEAPRVERQIAQPVPISANAEKSEQLSAFADTITGKDVKRFFQERGIAYSADVFVDPAYQDKIRKIWSACPGLASGRRTKDAKACWAYLEKLKEEGDDFSLKSLEIRKISIKLQNGETKEDYGVFATENIEKNAIIGIYAGKLQLQDEINDKDYTFSLPDEEFDAYGIDAKEMGNITRFINHSSRVNENICTMVFYDRITPRIVLAAKKPIKKGEQLLYDYGDEYWELKNITPVILTPSSAST